MSDETTNTADTATRPRIRAGAIAWGAIVIATASLVLWVAPDSARRAAAADWASALTPGAVVLIGVLVVGAVLLLAGVLAAIRRAQRRS